MSVTNFKCFLCGHNRHRLVASRLRDGSQKSKVYRCFTCGHVQLYPQPTIEKEKAYYDLNQQDSTVGKEIYFSAITNYFKNAGFKGIRIHFNQRCGWDNHFHEIKLRKPQIEKPVFTLAPEYGDVENYYKNHRTSRGVSDALIAVGTT